MMTTVQLIGALASAITGRPMCAPSMQPPVEEASCVEIVERAEITTLDYDRIRMQIEENNPGEGCMSFEETFEARTYTLDVRGTMWRRITETGDDYYTPREVVEGIEINVEFARCYNHEGDEIESDFEERCI